MPAELTGQADTPSYPPKRSL